MEGFNGVSKNNKSLVDSSFIEELLRLCKGEKKFISYENCRLELVQGNHPLPKEMIDGIDPESYSYVQVSYLCKNVSENGVKEESEEKGEDKMVEIVGSPLSLSADDRLWNHSESCPSEKREVLESVSPVEGRKVISMCLLSSLSMTERNLIPYPVWVFCNGTDAENVAFLSSHCKSSKNSGRFLIDNITVSVKGPYPDDYRFPPVADLVGRKQIKGNDELQYAARYVLYESSCVDLSDVDGRNYGSIDVLLQWDRPCSILSEPPPEASAMLGINLRAGDPKSAVHHMFEELVTLQGFVDGLKDGLVKWAIEDNVCSVYQQVEQLAEDQKRGILIGTKLDAGSNSDDDKALTRGILIRERMDLDFTEQLWKILRNCTSCEELAQTLNYVFENIQKKELQPMVHRNNKSWLARIIRESFQNEVKPLPVLEGTVPLELLVDIGLTKLFQDYSTAFLGSDLVTAGHLNQFLNHVGGSAGVVERLKSLEKLHLVLEMVTLLDQSLKVPQLTLSAVARQAFKYYEKNEVKKSDSFYVPVTVPSIASLLKDNLPRMWKASVLNVKEKSNDVESMVMLTTYQPFGHIRSTASATESFSESTDQKTFRYYLTHVHRTRLEM